jgi:hypothetical protein
MDTITRQIYFFKARAQNASFGDILTELSSLPLEDKCSGDGDNRKVFCEVEEQKGIYLGKICLWRSNDFPSIATIDELVIHPLHLGSKDGLVEVTHFVYFPEYEVLAVEYNYQGPRAGSLSVHINNKLNNVGASAEKARFVVFDPLFDPDTLQQLSRMKEVRVMSMMIPRKHIDAVLDLDKNLHTAFEAAGNVGEGEEIEIVLRPVPKGRKPLYSKDGMTDFVGMMKNFAKKHHFGEVFHNFTVKALDGATGKYREFDMLRDKCISEVRTVKQNSGRAVDGADLFEKIKDAYMQKRTELERIAKY